MDVNFFIVFKLSHIKYYEYIPLIYYMTILDVIIVLFLKSFLFLIFIICNVLIPIPIFSWVSSININKKLI